MCIRDSCSYSILHSNSVNMAIVQEKNRRETQQTQCIVVLSMVLQVQFVLDCESVPRDGPRTSHKHMNCTFLHGECLSNVVLLQVILASEFQLHCSQSWIWKPTWCPLTNSLMQCLLFVQSQMDRNMSLVWLTLCWLVCSRDMDMSVILKLVDCKQSKAFNR